jgi:hypothetical protein
MASPLGEVHPLKLTWIRERAVANSAFIYRRFFSNSSRIHLFTVACALMKKGASAVEQQFKRAWKYGDSTTLKAILHIIMNIMSAWRNFAASNVVTSPYASRTALLVTVATAEAPAEAVAWKVVMLDGRALSSVLESIRC